LYHYESLSWLWDGVQSLDSFACNRSTLGTLFEAVVLNCTLRRSATTLPVTHDSACQKRKKRHPAPSLPCLAPSGARVV